MHGAYKFNMCVTVRQLCSDATIKSFDLSSCQAYEVYNVFFKIYEYLLRAKLIGKR